MPSNAHALFIAAKINKKDEFYTTREVIDSELCHYTTQFRDKVVFCNCDDPYESNFVKYFITNFEYLGLKKLIATSYSPSWMAETQLSLFEDRDDANVNVPYKIEVSGVTGIRTIEDIQACIKDNVEQLTENGDFRSGECIDLLKKSDIVVTNPPFSLFREYISTLAEHDKKFLILGDQNVITTIEVFNLFKANKIWLGYDNGGTKWFQVPMDYDISTESRKKIVDGKKYFSMGRIYWYTNLEVSRNVEGELIPFRSYDRDPNYYLHYDNLDGIDVPDVADIPFDYEGLMGVPKTFVLKHDPNKFELVGIPTGNLGKEIGVTRNYRGRTDIAVTLPNGNKYCPFGRIIIRKINRENDNVGT